MNRHDAAIGRWIDALNLFGDRDALERAVTDNVQIDRYGWEKRRTDLAEVITGLDAAVQWMARSPESVVFSADGLSTVSGPTGTARYRLEATDFLGTGEWIFRLADDDRIEWIEHRPDDLRPEYGGE
jgi:hypothetical protein